MIPEKFVAERLRLLRLKLAESSLDALVLIAEESRGWENLFYFSGFKGSDAVVLITQDQAVLVTDSRYAVQAREQSSLDVRDMLPRESQSESVQRLLNDFSAVNIAFDAAAVSAKNYLRFSSYGGRWTDFSYELAGLRRHKDDWEISCIAKASQIAGIAYMETLSLVKPGMTELEFAKQLELAISRHQGEGVWHNSDMIVASGVRGAMPHGVATDKRMEKGESVTVDYGAIYGAYMSDITRNFSLGKPADPLLIDLHEILFKAHHDAADLLRPGIKASAVHAVAQKVIADAGYGGCFGHALGHSLGLEIHEMPHLSLRSNEVLEVGDVVTVEPGIYLPGRGGLRLEDDYLIVADGAVRLTKELSQDFIHVPV